MALVAVGGGGSGIFTWPALPYQIDGGEPFALDRTLTLDAAAEQNAFLGALWHPGLTGTKSLTKVHFKTGATITSAGGTEVKISIQGYSTTNDAPDGTIKGGGSPASVTTELSALSTSTWTTVTLANAYTVSFGELLAVVFELTNFAGSDVFTSIHGYQDQHANIGGAYVSTDSGSTWAITSVLTGCNIMFEFGDGTFGCFVGELVGTAVNHTSFGSGNDPDEYGMEFTIPFDCSCCGMWVTSAFAGDTSDPTVKLYDTDGTTILNGGGSGTAILGERRQSTTRMALYVLWDQVTLAAGSTYRLTLDNAGAGTVSVSDLQLGDATYRQMRPGGTAVALVSKADAGTWNAATTTKIPFMGLLLSQIDDGAAAAAGGVGGSCAMPRGLL